MVKPLNIVPKQPSEDVVAEPRYFNGLVFKHVASLGLWGAAMVASVVVNLMFYGWTRLDIGPFDAPSAGEQTSVGGYLMVYASLYATAAVVLLHGARSHPRRMLMPWMMMGAIAGIHVLLGFPLVVTGVNEAGAGGLGLMFWLNPLTYVAALPVVLTLARASNWGFVLPKVAAGLVAVTAVGVVFLGTV